MRIIGGEFRGRRLASVGKGDAGAHLRPTADRVRESLFNMLAGGFGDPCRGAVVLDMFAGTGALGLEALSRGAELAKFVENGRTALRLLRENIGICRVEASARVVQRDARKLGACPVDAATLVFLDPPYGKQMGEAALTVALAGGWIAKGALIVWEESAEIIAPEGLNLLDERRYGDTVIRIFEHV